MTVESDEKINQAIKLYLDKEISGSGLSLVLTQYKESLGELNKKHSVTFKYYIELFGKEGNNLYIPSNKYLKEEIVELKDFLKTLS